MRTDNNNNPVAFTTEIARQAGLNVATEYFRGDQFPNNGNLFTAKLIGDPIAITIKVIDRVGFSTAAGNPRWIYINIPKFIWDKQTFEIKRDIIGYMYQYEGGVSMRHLFPNYGKL